MAALTSTALERPARRRLTELLGDTAEYLNDDLDVGLVAAAGTLRGVRVICISQDRTVAGGSLGAREGAVAESAVSAAVRVSVPLVLVVESAGARVDDGCRALDAYGILFRRLSHDARRVPRVTLVVGPAAGGGAYAAALGDITVMTRRARMFLTGPRVVAEALGETVSAEALGGPGIHEANGVCDLCVEDDAAGMVVVGDLIELLGRRRRPTSTAAAAPDPGGLVPASQRAAYDVRAIVERLLDADTSIELAARWARSIVTCVGRLAGRTVGVLANQPQYLGGVLTASAADKAARFVRFCSRHDVPLVVLVDTPGFMPGSREEADGIIRRGAALVEAFAQARNRRVTVIVRKAFGGGYIAMNSRGLGARAVLGWPDARIGVLGPEQAVQLMRARLSGHGAGTPLQELAARYTEEHLTAECALRCGALDEIVEPAVTRRRAEALLFGEDA